MRSTLLLLAIVCAQAAIVFSPAEASCTRATWSQTQSLRDSFKVRPAGILDRYPRGGPELSNLLAQTVSADPAELLDRAVELVRVANSVQRQAIGHGLGLVVQSCQAHGQPETARRIQEAVRRRADRDMTMGFVAATAPAAAPASPRPKAEAEPAGGSLEVRPDAPVFGPRSTGDPLRPIRPLIR